MNNPLTLISRIRARTVVEPQAISMGTSHFARRSWIVCSRHAETTGEVSDLCHTSFTRCSGS